MVLLRKEKMTLKQAEKLMRIWQVRLRLMDWDINLCFEPKLTGTTTYGTTDMRTRWKEADIELRPDDTNMEVTLVHELLHVKFPLLSRKLANSDGVDVYEEELELGIESTARALVEGWNS